MQVGIVCTDVYAARHRERQREVSYGEHGPPYETNGCSMAYMNGAGVLSIHEMTISPEQYLHPVPIRTLRNQSSLKGQHLQNL
jgi:hypothetical protein